MRREQMHMVLDVLLDMGQKLAVRPVPPEAKQHFKAAQKEVLLGVRAFVDNAIDRMDEDSVPSSPKSIRIDTE
ncbi:MAG TPA: hypothetical protein VD973_00035 [Symbiobacteriaceae bacterium]|nr:hypothetical protein [Symbiobacteriaceae bacterium]